MIPRLTITFAILYAAALWSIGSNLPAAKADRIEVTK